MHTVTMQSGSLLVMEEALVRGKFAFRMVDARDENVVFRAGGPRASTWALEVEAMGNNLAGERAALTRYLNRRNRSGCCPRESRRPRKFRALEIGARSFEVLDFLDGGLLVAVQQPPSADDSCEPADMRSDVRRVR